MERPNAELVRKVLPMVDWVGLAGAVPQNPTEDDPDPLEFWVQAAVDYAEEVTGRPMDETMPARFVRAAQLVVALLASQQLINVSPDQMEAVAGAEVLQSFSADGYSESYRAPGDVDKAAAAAKMINPNPTINRLLWMLATDAKKAEWLAFWDPDKYGTPQWGIAPFPGLHNMRGFTTPPVQLGAFFDPNNAWPL